MGLRPTARVLHKRTSCTRSSARKYDGVKWNILLRTCIDVHNTPPAAGRHAFTTTSLASTPRVVAWRCHTHTMCLSKTSHGLDPKRYETMCSQTCNRSVLCTTAVSFRMIPYHISYLVSSGILVYICQVRCTKYIKKRFILFEAVGDGISRHNYGNYAVWYLP